MFWTLLKTTGGLIAGSAATKVTSDIIKALTTRAVGVRVVMGETQTIGRISYILPHNTVEKAVLAVGTFVIAGAVGVYVGSQVSREIEEIEDFVKTVRADTDAVIQEIKNNGA